MAITPRKSIFTGNLLKVFVVLSMGLAACAPQNNSSSVRVAGRGGVITSTGTGFISGSPPVSTAGGSSSGMPANNATCSNSATGTGVLNQWTTSSVLDLVSATISKQSFGDICKVNFSSNLKFDANGNVLPSGSAVLIQIVDTWAGQVYNGKTILPYEIQFQNATAGSYNRSTGFFQVNFADQYGSFSISGQVTGGMANGTVIFMNSVAVQGYSPASGTLGQFSIPAVTLLN